MAPEGLVGWWPGDGNSDDVEGGNDATLQGGATFGTGEVLQAFSFDGIDDFASLPVLGFGPALTIDAWVNISNTGTFKAIVSVCDDPNSDCTGTDYKVALLRVNANGSVSAGISFSNFSMRRTFATTADSGLVTPGQWRHLATTMDTSTNSIQIYLDGVAQTLTLNNVGVGSGSFSAAPYIGGRHSVFGGVLQNRFNGLIDEVEIFDRELTAGEIGAIVDAGSAGKCKDEDGDGFRPPDDCDETNASINPNAVELPGNFVDEDCNGDLGVCDPCLDWKNHGQYVRCIAQDSEALVESGILTDEEGDALVTSAAQSSIGKKGFQPQQCTP